MYIKGTYIKPSNIIAYNSPFTITGPVGGTIRVGDNYTLSVDVVGVPPFYYKWYKNSIEIPSQISNQLIITNATLNDDASYYCVISNNSFSKQSNTVKLNVYEPPLIVKQPVSINTNPNTTVFFDASATGSSPITYNWYKGNTLISSSVNNLLYIFNTQTTDIANYYCVMSNQVGSVTSNTVQLSLNTPLAVVTLPNNITLNPGQTLNTSLSCTGTTPITAQWRKDGVNVKPQTVHNTGSIPLLITNMQVTNEGNYDCVLSNIVGTITSNSFIVHVNESVIFTLQPVSTTIQVGNSHTFSVDATGSEPISYKWIKTNPYVDLGKFGKTLTFNSAQLSDQANYACVASNAVGSVTSTSVTLSVVQAGINIQPMAKTIAAGGSHSLFLGIDGTLSGCGLNNFGQLGDANATSRSTPVKINLPPVAMVAIGANHSLFLGIDGTLSACGQNYGQLGDGTKTHRSTPIKINLPPIADIASKNNHSLFLGIDGTLSACGNNTFGQLGDGTTTHRSTPIKINLPPVAAIVVGTFYTLFLGIDGTLSACGSNNYGQLGDGTTTNRTTPIKINLPPVAAIAGGEIHSLFLGIDGTLSACGSNNYGQLGDGTTTNRSTPIKINLPPIADIASKNNHSLFLGIDGTLSACGSNNYGQLGDGTNIGKSTPVKINVPLIKL